METFSNVVDWKEADAKKKIMLYAKNSKSLILEIGCGRGEYTVALAEMDKESNFVGIDYQGERIWHGAKYALENKLENVLFFRGFADKLSEYFPVNSVDEIWLTFPDPYLKEKRAKRRLTSLQFLEIYKKILKKKHRIHLKTDDVCLFEFSKECITEMNGKIIREYADLYSVKRNDEILYVQTKYEKAFLKLNKKIHYLEFEL